MDYVGTFFYVERNMIQFYNFNNSYFFWNGKCFYKKCNQVLQTATTQIDRLGELPDILLISAFLGFVRLWIINYSEDFCWYFGFYPSIHERERERYLCLIHQFFLCFAFSTGRYVKIQNYFSVKTVWMYKMYGHFQIFFSQNF